MFAHTIGWPEKESAFYRLATEMERTCLTLADAVYSSSNYSTQWCSRHYGLDSARIPTLHLGVDTRAFYPRGTRKESRPTIVFAGRLTRNKGVEVLVDAACALRREFPDVRLRLLGKGEPALTRELQKRAAQNGAHELLDLPGFVEHSELPLQLSRAHVYAGPSLCEGGPGLSYLEAMACGLPVVASSGSGAAEVVVDGQTGLLVAPGDSAALTAALRRLLADAERREAMGARGRSYVETEADTRRCAVRLEAFYRSVLSTSNSAVSTAGDRHGDTTRHQAHDAAQGGIECADCAPAERGGATP
jgi:starch synthase